MEAASYHPEAQQNRSIAEHPVLPWSILLGLDVR